MRCKEITFDASPEDAVFREVEDHLALMPHDIVGVIAARGH
jgi:hypothetical protein